MEFRNSNDSMRHTNEVVIFMEDSSDNEDNINYSAVIRALASQTNNMIASGFLLKKGIDVEVQTVPDINEISNSWIVNAERNIDKFCVQLSNIQNILYLHRNRVAKTKSKALPSATTKKIQSEKSCDSSSKEKSPVHSKQPVSKCGNVEDLLTYELIKDRIESALVTAIELRSSIPKINVEKLFNIFKEREVTEITTVKETNILRLQRSKSSMHRTKNLPPKHNSFKREKTFPTISESKTRHPSKLSHRTGKFENICSVPKTKNVVKAKNSVPGTFRQTCNVQGRDLQFQDVTVPTKETGAIPKIRDAKKSTSSNSTIRAQKTKKTDVKPLWK